MENGDVAIPTAKEESVVTPFKKYITENILMVLWNGVLAFGGLLFLIYFWKIQYFPNLDMSSAVAFLAAAAITGLGLSVLLAFMLVFPGWFHREILSDIDRPLFVDAAREYRRGLLFFTAPMALGTAVFWSIWKECDWYLPAVLIGAYVVLVIVCEVGLKGIADLSAIKKLKLLLVSTINGLMFVVTSWFVVLILALQYERNLPEADRAVWEVFAAMTVIAIFVNALIARSGNWLWWFTPAMSIFCLGLLLILSQQLTMIPSFAIRLLKLGDFSADLILDQQGNQIASQFIKPDATSALTADSAQSKGNKDAVKESPSSDDCVVRSIKILSRAGAEYYLEVQVPGKASQDTEPKEKLSPKNRFIIPASHVLSWEAIEKGKEGPTRLECAKVETKEGLNK